MAGTGVIMAASVDKDGALDRPFKERISACLRARRNGRVLKIIVTGSARHDKTHQTIAEFARDELCGLGVLKEEAIVPEHLQIYPWNTKGDVWQAVDTFLLNYFPAPIIVFTDFFHYFFRVKPNIKRQFKKAFRTAPQIIWGGGVPLRLYDLLRELGDLTLRPFPPEARKRLRLLWKRRIAPRFTQGEYLGDQGDDKGSSER